MARCNRANTGWLCHTRLAALKRDPALGTDNFNLPGGLGQSDFLKLHLFGRGVTFQAQPFDQRGQPDAVLIGESALG